MSNADLVVIHVSVNANPETQADFEVTLREIVREAAASEGCLRYEWYRVPQQPYRYAIYGEFESRASFQRYRESEIVKRIGKELIPLLVEKPSFRHYLASVLETS